MIVRRRTMAHRISAVMAGLLGLLALAGPVAAASVTFGTPTATSSFGKSIVFTQPYAGASLESARIFIQFPGDLGPLVASVKNPGATSLTYTITASAGSLAPNEPVVAHFEVTLVDGSIHSGPEVHVTYADDRFNWKIKVGKVVKLHWIDATDSFVQQMVDWADAGVAKAAQFLGVTESQPIDFFVYPSADAFRQGVNAAETIGGQAQPSFRTCYAIIPPGDSTYARSVLPHEVTHIVFGDVTENPYHGPPNWFNEGFATYMADGYDANDRQLVSQAAHGGTLPNLFSLSANFSKDPSRIYLAYAESVSAIDFMVRKYGPPAVVKVLKQYTSGSTDDEAFSAGLGVDVAAFNSAWLADNGVTSSQTFGPQTAPAGPVPPGWTTSGGSQVGPGATPPTAGSSAGTSGQGSGGQSGNGSGEAGLLIAAVLALFGVVLLGVAGVTHARGRHAQPRL